MFEFITHLFSFNSLAPVELHSIPSWLPAPGWYAGLAGLLMLGVVGAVLLLKDIRLAVELGVGAAVLSFLAYAAIGYEHMGENRLIPERNALAAQVQMDKDRADSFRADAAALQAQLAKERKRKAPIIIKQVQATEEAIHAQPEAVRAIVVPAAVGSLLDSAINATTGDADSAGPGGTASHSGADPYVPRLRDEAMLGYHGGGVGVVVEQTGRLVPAAGVGLQRPAEVRGWPVSGVGEVERYAGS